MPTRGAGFPYQVWSLRVKSKLRITGLALVGIAVIGFLTVADDLRHIGELVGVGSIMLSGLVLLGLPLVRNRSKRQS
jgi:hypothetical protein